jgi:hypothetical protein
MDSNAGVPLTSTGHVTETRSPKEQKLSPNQQQLNSKPNQVIKLLLLLVFSPWASLAGTTAQSVDRYGSGTLHSGQVLRGSLPLLSSEIKYTIYNSLNAQLTLIVLV